jgi:hypothetical protein
MAPWPVEALSGAATASQGGVSSIGPPPGGT